jgi:N-methylhydantoinase A
VQVVTLRQSVVVPRALIDIKPSAAPAVSVDPIPVTRREVWFESAGMVSTPVYDRSALAPGTTFEGPAIVVQMDATTLIPPQHRVHVDGFTHLIVEAL